MRHMLCFYSTCLLYTRVIQKVQVYPILNNWIDDKSTMKTMVETESTISRRWRQWLKAGGLHIIWMFTDVMIGLYTLDEVISGDRPDVLGDRPVMRGPLSYIGHTGRGIRCLRFRSDPEWTCKWMCVWHWISFCVIDIHQLHSVNCLCGMLICKWSRLLLKRRVLWLMIKARL